MDLLSHSGELRPINVTEKGQLFPLPPSPTATSVDRAVFQNQDNFYDENLMPQHESPTIRSVDGEHENELFSQPIETLASEYTFEGLNHDPVIAVNASSFGQGPEHSAGRLNITDGLLNYSVLPNCKLPCTYREEVYFDMVHEARIEHKAGRFNTAEPSLTRVLAKDPVDVLSFRLFHYMVTWGGLPLHLFLAVFWVHYLYLRVSLSILFISTPALL